MVALDISQYPKYWVSKINAHMNWKILSELPQIDQIVKDSFEQPVIIFKHSTRCSISDMAKGRLEREVPPENLDFYYLDLLNYRSISNKLAEQFSVHHESPQILLIQNGECIYVESHNGISMQDIADQVNVF
jgi:bacillithiol system protein YtxJ